MTKCRYILEGKNFSSENELDDYLIEMKTPRSIFGDVVYSMKFTPRQWEFKKKIEDSDKMASEHIEEDMTDHDEIDNIHGDGKDYIGVSSLINEMRTGEGKRIVPEFIAEKYWDHVKTDFMRGDFSKYQDIVPYLFKDKDADGNYITSPVKNEQQFEDIRDRITKIWAQQGLCGTVCHDAYRNFFMNRNQFLSSDRKGQMKIMKDTLTKYSKAYNTLKSPEYRNDIMSDKLLGSLVDMCLDFNNQIGQTFGKDAFLLPEKTITGTGTVNGKLMHVIGRTDLLIMRRNGDIVIIDYKFTPKERFDSAKILTFNYQLAAYRRIIQQLGLNGKQPRLFIVPSKFMNFTADDKNRVHFDGIGYDKKNMLQELSISDSINNKPYYDMIEGHLDLVFPKTYQEDASAEDVLKATDDFMKKIAPQYNNDRNTDLKNVQEYINNTKSVIQNPKTKKWEYRKQKTSAPIIFDTEQDAVKYIRQQWISKLRRRTQNINDIKEAVRNNDRSAIKFSNVLGQGAVDKEFSSKVLRRYANERYDVVDTDKYARTLSNMGIILFRNRDTGMIDVVRISNRTGINRVIHLGGKNQNHTLTGTFVDDYAQESDPRTKSMESTEGNLELMETMAILNRMPSLFDNGNATLGRIQLISSNNLGDAADNASLLYNFTALMKMSGSKEPINFYYSAEGGGQHEAPIKMASFTDLAADDLHNIKYTGSSVAKYDQYTGYEPSIYNALGNPKAMLAELTSLKEKLEENNPRFKTGYVSQYYNDYDDPLTRVYSEVIMSIGELHGINYQQQLRDHAKFCDGSILSALIWKGWNGTQFDNPGTMKSTTLNQISRYVESALQNCREGMYNISVDLDKQHKELKGGRLTENLYNNMYDEEAYKAGELKFKNPYEQTALTPQEREYLKFALLKINMIRDKRIQNEDDLKKALSNDPDKVLLVPAIDSMKHSSKNDITHARYSLHTSQEEVFKSLNPKNWHLMASIDKFLEKNTKDNTGHEDIKENPATTLTWEMGNQFSATENPDTRKSAIANMGGLDNVEKNVDLIILKFAYADKMKEQLDDVFPLIKALTYHLANQGIILNQNFENDLKYISDYITKKIQHKNEADFRKLGMMKKPLITMMRWTSFAQLAFNVHQAYQFPDGLWKDVALVIRKPGDNNVFTKKNFADSYWWIMQDTYKGQDTVGNGLNKMYGINDMDADILPERLSHAENKFMKWAFMMASRPDYYNRLTIFGAQMRGDGCFEAHSMKDGKLVYDFTKDKRFSLLVDPKADKNSAEYKKQEGLYYTMAQDMENDHTIDADGTPFTVDYSRIKALPKAYTVRQSESIKALCDKVYGYYSSEKRSMIQATTLGQIIMQMNTFWSSKKNQYFSGRVYTQDGEYVQYEQKNQMYDASQPESAENPKMIKWYTKYDKNIGQMIPTKENTGVPFVVWKGRPQEGIVITLTHMLKSMYDTGRQEGSFIKGIKGGRDMYIHNDDPYLQKMYKANLWQLTTDMIGALFFGMLIGLPMKKAANAYYHKQDKDDFGGMASADLLLFLQRFYKSSTDDFWGANTVLGRGVQWTPFMLQSATNILKKAGSVVTGQKDWYDMAATMFGGETDFKPLLDYQKMKLLGRSIGNNGKTKDNQ